MAVLMAWSTRAPSSSVRCPSSRQLPSGSGDRCTERFCSRGVGLGRWGAGAFVPVAHDGGGVADALRGQDRDVRGLVLGVEVGEVVVDAGEGGADLVAREAAVVERGGGGGAPSEAAGECDPAAGGRA